jgi:hypothetical protein
MSELEATFSWATFSCFVQSQNHDGGCRGKKFGANELRVPSLSWLFMVERNTGLDRENPLMEAEVSKHARCTLHSAGPLSAAYDEENGIAETYTLAETLNVMAHWKERISRKEQQRERRLQSKQFKPPSVPMAPKPKNYGPDIKLERTKKKGKPDGKKKGKKNAKGDQAVSQGGKKQKRG